MSAKGARSTCWRQDTLVEVGRNSPGYPPAGTDLETAPAAIVLEVGGDTPVQGIVVPIYIM